MSEPLSPNEDGIEESFAAESRVAADLRLFMEEGFVGTEAFISGVSRGKYRVARCGRSSIGFNDTYLQLLSVGALSEIPDIIACLEKIQDEVAKKGES